MRRIFQALAGAVVLYGIVAWLLLLLSGGKTDISPGPLVKWPVEVKGYGSD